MASNAQRYAVGIGTGAASGASLGTSILPGWGTLIGGVLGAGAGAIGAAAGNSDEAKRRQLIEEQRAREKKMLVLEILRKQAVENGYDPTLLDVTMKKKGMDYQHMLEDRAYANANRLDANAFVPMAMAGAQTAAGLYKGFQTPNVQSAPSGPIQLTPLQGGITSDNYPGSGAPEQWAQNAASNFNEYDPNGQPQWARRLQL